MRKNPPLLKTASILQIYESKCSYSYIRNEISDTFTKEVQFFLHAISEKVISNFQNQYTLLNYMSAIVFLFLVLAE